jgi:LPXTG-motif cell wall-anchored protein
MNFAYFPLLLVVGLMAATVAGMLLYFRRKSWI